MPNILSEEEIEEKLKLLPGWKREGNKIMKEFSFKDFMDSLGFITALAPFFEKNDHHPDAAINYNKVLFTLTRYDVGEKLTDLDFTTAEEIERLYSERA